MRRLVPFFLFTLILGWIFQALFLYYVPPGLPTPQWLLLAVLALGSRGRTKFAMSLGFLWGLALDACGMSSFGVQGWLLALAGYASGTLSKNLDADKLGTQASLAVSATGVLWVGVRLLSSLFDHSLVGRPGLGLAAAQLVLNALAAPAIFWAMSVWGEFWDPHPKNDDA